MDASNKPASAHTRAKNQAAVVDFDDPTDASPIDSGGLRGAFDNDGDLFAERGGNLTVLQSDWSFNVVGLVQIAPERRWGFDLGGNVRGRQGYPLPFDVECTDTINFKTGLLFYGFGAAAIPFQGGTLCVNPQPLRRAVPVNSGGTGNNCDGEFLIDMNAFASGQLGGNPAGFLLIPGTVVNAQWWGRDTVQTGSLLSDALEYMVCP